MPITSPSGVTYAVLEMLARMTRPSEQDRQAKYMDQLLKYQQRQNAMNPMMDQVVPDEEHSRLQRSEEAEARALSARRPVGLDKMGRRGWEQPPNIQDWMMHRNAIFGRPIFRDWKIEQSQKDM